jgi:hypothetical protein
MQLQEGSLLISSVLSCFFPKNDIAGLHCLMAVSLCRGASTQTICTLLDCAIAGVYKPQGRFSA